MMKATGRREQQQEKRRKFIKYHVRENYPWTYVYKGNPVTVQFAVAYSKLSLARFHSLFVVQSRSDDSVLSWAATHWLN